MYCILWNQSQVASWIEEMLDNDCYNETLVLETMQPVHNDKYVSKLGTEFCTQLTVQRNPVWIFGTAFYMKIYCHLCVRYMVTMLAFQILLFTMLFFNVPLHCSISSEILLTLRTFQLTALVYFLMILEEPKFIF